MIWQQDQLLQAGKYPIIRQIGGGGFGLTYLAEDYSFNRQVVIKAPNQAFQADQEYQKFVRRFQREAEVLEKISHPNVVQVIEFFQAAGIPCLVMAYINGETLNQRIREQGPLSEAEAVEHFRTLAAALQTVHKIGMIHCDIHPGNIMLQRQSNKPVLIDFGSAKLLQPTTVTITTTVNDFTPYEQRQEKKRKPTLDVYALAATLYFTVTGEKPEAAIDRKLYGDTLKSPQQYYPELSNWLNQAILKGMALEAEDRPQSMQEWLGLLHPTQPKKPNNQLNEFSFPLIPLSFVLLFYTSVGTLVGLGNNGIWDWVLVLVLTLFFAGLAVLASAVAWAWPVAWAVFCAVFWAWFWAWFGVVFLAVFLAMTVVSAGSIDSLKKQYNLWSIFLILGTTSTLGLVLGSILSWFLKL
ncbi:MAG: protein kinase [Microcoleaceae cyanobacterium]